MAGWKRRTISGSYIFVSHGPRQLPDTRRGIIQGGTLAEYIKNPEFIHDGFENPAKDMTLYPD